MSDQRPEWMPSRETVLAATLGSLNETRLDKQFHNTGLRAQIAVLERENYMTGFSTWRVNKIAALRKELENG